MTTAQQSTGFMPDPGELAELALKAVTETQKRLNNCQSWDIGVVQRFFEVASQVPLAHTIAANRDSRLVETGIPRKGKKGAPLSSRSDDDILDLPVQVDDSYDVWKRRWRFSVKLHGALVADVNRPESSRNTWFARQLSQ